MSEYTPTTWRVRQRWLEAYEYERDMPGKIREKYPDEVLAQFDRWLTEHDRLVAERAWEEGARWAAVEFGRDAFVDESRVGLVPSDNPYRKEQENNNA